MFYISTIVRPAEKILVTELRNSLIPEKMGYIAGNAGTAQWTQPAIRVEAPGDQNWAGGVPNSAWYSLAGDNGQSRHFDGCNSLFADGHVKFMTNQSGVLWLDLSGPPNNLAKHWWDPTYDG